MPLFYTSLLHSIAFASVISSANSMSEPIGIPKAMRLTLTVLGVL